MFSSRQSIMPLGKAVVQPLPNSDAHESAKRIMRAMAQCRDASYAAASCLRSDALQIERLNTVLDCTEYFVLVREDATQRYQEQLKATIDPQIQELLKMAEERSEERTKIEGRRKLRSNYTQSSTTPKADNAAITREQLLQQHKARLQKEIQRMKVVLDRS